MVITLIKREFLKNAVAVCAVSLIMSTVGMFFRTYVSNRVGAEAMGLLQLILSVYYPACTLASSGIYVASTRLNAEAFARGDRSPADILNRCFLYSTLFGGAAFAVLFFGAEFIAVHWLKHPDAALALKILSFGLPFLSAANALQGFFLALRRAAYSTFLQISEDVFKITSTMLLFAAFLHRGPAAALCALTAGMAIGEILSCVSGCFLYRHKLNRLPSVKRSDPAPVFPEILRIALPCAFSAYLRSGVNLVGNVIVPRRLEASGMTAEQTLAAMGKVDGMTLSALMFPSVFLTVVSKLLVPEITADQVTGKDESNRKVIRSVLRWTLTYALFLAGFAVLFGKELGMTLYGDPACGTYITRLAPLIPLLYCDSVTDGMIKGYNRQAASMRINLADALLRTFAAWFLLPKTGVTGYIAIKICGSAFNFALSLRLLLRSSGAQFPLGRGVLTPFLCTASVLLPIKAIAARQSLSVWICGAAGAILYAALIFLFAKIDVRYTPLRKAVRN